jgi:ectoine hydroxylase-related dioxygenase (phytanoyl-CoA dioxygenase family)
MDYDSELACDAAAIDLDRAVATLEKYGCLVLRNVLPRDVLEQILKRAVAEYDELERNHQAGRLSETQTRRNYGYGILRPFEDDLRMPDATPMRDAILGFAQTGVLHDIVEGYLGRNVSLLLEACHIRRQGPGQPGRPVPLHQDCSVMRMKRGRMLNFWVPLVDGAGASAPGLEFYPKSLDRILECPRRPASDDTKARMYSNFEITEDDVRAAIGDLPSWRPVLNRGDVLCLDGWTVHRTNFDSSMSAMRYGFEIRFCRNADLQPGMPGEIRPFQSDRWVA